MSQPENYRGHLLFSQSTSKYLASTSCVTGSETPPEQSVSAADMSIVIDCWIRDPRQLPPVRRQSRSEFELFKRMKVSIGEVPHRFDCLDSVESAAIEPIDVPQRCMSLSGLLSTDRKILPFNIFLRDQPTDGSKLWVAFQQTDSHSQEIGVERHISVEKIKVFAVRILKCELSTGSTATLGEIGQLDNIYGISTCNLNGVVGRAAVGQHDAASKWGSCSQCTFNRHGDVALLIERLNTDGDH